MNLDTRPRCGGTPGKPWLIHKVPTSTPHEPSCYCKGCADCAPDTQSGGSPTATGLQERLGLAQQRIAQRVPFDTDDEDVRDFRTVLMNFAEQVEALHEARDENATLREHLEAAKDAIREYEARARVTFRSLQAADSTIAGLREQVAAQDRELAALSSDKQTLMTAVTHWREQVEGLRAALESTVADWKREEDWREEIGYTPGDACNARRRLERVLYPPAATRPVPVPPTATAEGLDITRVSVRGEDYPSLASVWENDADDAPPAAIRPVPAPQPAPCTECGRVFSHDCRTCLAEEERYYRESAPAAPGDGALPPDKEKN